MRVNQFVALVASSLCVAQATQTCNNNDYQVVVYRYSDTKCTASDETVSYYQSGSLIRESTDYYKTFTCCDDKSQVSVTDVTTSGTNTVTVADDECLSGAVANTGSTGTSVDKSFKFECVENPTQAEITITVYGSGATSCSAENIAQIRLGAYEGCNEDFNVIMDLTCDGPNVTVMWSQNVVGECEALLYDQNPSFFTLAPGCNLPDPNDLFFGIFDSPIQLTTTCGIDTGLSAGATAAIVIIILLLLGAGGFAYWWFKLRTAASSSSVDFTEYNEYSQLDGDQVDTDLL